MQHIQSSNHYAKNLQPRRVRTKKGDMQRACLRHHVLHYNGLGDKHEGASLIWLLEKKKSDDGAVDSAGTARTTTHAVASGFAQTPPPSLTPPWPLVVLTQQRLDPRAVRGVGAWMCTTAATGPRATCMSEEEIR
jgi:hypothetical protein